MKVSDSHKIASAIFETDTSHLTSELVVGNGLRVCPNYCPGTELPGTLTFDGRAICAQASRNQNLSEPSSAQIKHLTPEGPTHHSFDLPVVILLVHSEGTLNNPRSKKPAASKGNSKTLSIHCNRTQELDVGTPNRVPADDEKSHLGTNSTANA